MIFHSYVSLPEGIPYLLSTLFQVGYMIVIQPKILKKIRLYEFSRWGRKTTTNVKRDGYDVFTVLEIYQKSMEFPCSGHCVAGKPLMTRQIISESPGLNISIFVWGIRMNQWITTFGQSLVDVSIDVNWFWFLRGSQPVFWVQGVLRYWEGAWE